IDGETRTVPWPKQDLLLDALRRAGVDAPFSCREGSCAACACVVLEGEASMDANTVLDEQDLADGLILACQARPVTDRLKVTYDGWNTSRETGDGEPRARHDHGTGRPDPRTRPGQRRPGQGGRPGRAASAGA